MVVLEDASFARARGARLRGRILGHATGFEPEPTGSEAGAGLAAAIRTALADADLVPEALGLVVSAAPPALASLEGRALDRVLGSARPPILNPKDAYGETFGAAGPLGLLAAFSRTPCGGAVLVLDVCASGHVAALVARPTDPNGFPGGPS